jgi:hypothetical protein
MFIHDEAFINGKATVGISWDIGEIEARCFEDVLRTCGAFCAVVSKLDDSGICRAGRLFLAGMD